MTQLILVRHGTTDANVRVPYILQGSGIDLSLNDNGRRQADRVAAFLALFPVKHVYASTLKRASETAGLIAAHHALPVTQIAEFMECDVGQWEGKDWETIAREAPEAYRLFHEDPATQPYLGGESYSDVLRRSLPVFERLLQQHVGDTIVIVAHNIVNRALIAHLLGLEMRRAKELSQGNCCVNIIQHQDGKNTLVTMNSLFHLEEKRPVVASV
jgi:broad specificity phosphatase PhoE